MASATNLRLHPPGRLLSRLSILLLALALTPTPVLAVPSFARQTGASCSVCHIQSFGPDLTPFGRGFKLNGYTLGEGSKLPPLSAMLRGSFTHTARRQPGGPGEDFNSNNNSTFDEAALLYAGRIYDKLGGFIQLTYDASLGDTLFLDNTDIRYANTSLLAGASTVYGISLNNSPTVQDIWNTTPVWGFPYADSPLAPTPGASTLIGNLGGQVVGASAYLMWNDLLYAEAGTYTSLSRETQHALNTFEPDGNKIDGTAPYWRVALQHSWDNQYFSIGHFAMRASLFPEHNASAGKDRITDLGIDATYQNLGDYQNIYEIKGSYLDERQNLDASQTLGLSSNASNWLRTLNLDATYTYQQTYGLTVALFKTWGSTDALRYSDGINGNPDSNGYRVEANYMPFGKVQSSDYPWLNLRLGLQYTGYLKFNGRRGNYDSAGRDAVDNNTLLLNAWIIL